MDMSPEIKDMFVSSHVWHKPTEIKPSEVEMCNSTVNTR